MSFGKPRKASGNGAPPNVALKPGDYVCKLEKITEPEMVTFPTGQKEVVRFIFAIGDTTHEEQLTNSTWPGGTLKNGQYASPSKLFTWLSSLTGLKSRNEIEELDGRKFFGAIVKVRIANNQAGYPHVTVIRMAKSDELAAYMQEHPDAGFTAEEEPADPFEAESEEVPF